LKEFNQEIKVEINTQHTLQVHVEFAKPVIAAVEKVFLWQLKLLIEYLQLTTTEQGFGGARGEECTGTDQSQGIIGPQSVKMWPQCTW
jgi:hypothetical protein